MTSATGPIILDMVRGLVYSAAGADALDSLGLRHQSTGLQFQSMTRLDKLVGCCKTTLWIDFSYDDPNAYELELEAVDSCRSDDVVICAAGGSMRSAVWGEILSTAARNAGCVGAVVDGAVRDIAQMTEMHFSVFA